MTGTTTATALVITIDDNYALQAACLFGSLAATSAASVDRIIVLGCGLSERMADELGELATKLGFALEVRDVAGELRKKGDLPFGHLALAAWARLLAPDIYRDLDRCLYLDADTICLADIGSLLTTDLDGRVVGAVQDVFHPTLGSPVCLPHLELSQEQRREPYFNAGVLVIDVARWREQEITSQAFAFVREHPESLRFWDQDALNAVLIGRWKAVDRKWNVPPVRDILDTLKFGYFGRKQMKAPDFVRLEANASIVHYLTELKPWLPEFPKGMQLERYRSALCNVAALLGESPARSAARTRSSDNSGLSTALAKQSWLFHN